MVVLMITLTGSQKLKKDQLQALIVLIKALIYVRVSTDDQVKNYSIDSQIERCVEMAMKELGCLESEIMILVEDGESGDNPNRPMINYALFLMEYGIGDALVILHPNRLSRHLNLQQNLSHRIWGMGKDLKFVEFDLDPDSPESMFNFNIQGSVSQYNKAKILADTKRGRWKKARSGKIPGMRRKYGYIFDKVNDTLIENDDEKSVFLKAVEMLLFEDKTCSDISREFSLKPIPGPSGDKWYPSTISRMLQDESYTGVFYYGQSEVKQIQGVSKQVKRPREEWVPIQIPKFISKETHLQIIEKIKTLTKRKAGRPTESYMLKGLVRCGRCGKSVSSGITSTTSTKKHKYYSCVGKSKKYYTVGSGESNEVCRGRNWRVDAIDKFVWDYLAELISKPQNLINEIINNQLDHSKIQEYNDKRITLTKSLAEQNTIKNRYNDLYARGNIKTLDELDDKVSEVEKAISRLKEDLDEVNSLLIDISSNESELDIMVNALTRYQESISGTDLPMEEKKAIVNTFINKVVLHEDGNIDIKLFVRKSTNKHNNLIISESHGIDFYVNDSIIMKKVPAVYKKKWDQYIDRLPEFIHMNHNEQLGIYEIEKRTGVKSWIVKQVLNKCGAEYKTYERKKTL